MMPISFFSAVLSGRAIRMKKCQQIANEGYKIHALYPAANPEDLPENEMKRMLYLDDIWMKECVAVLPAGSIINIADNVERDIKYGE